MLTILLRHYERCVHFQMGLNDFAILFKFIAMMTFQFIFCCLQSFVNKNSSAIRRLNDQNYKILIQNPNKRSKSHSGSGIGQQTYCTLQLYILRYDKEQGTCTYVNSFIKRGKIQTKTQIIMFRQQLIWVNPKKQKYFENKEEM